MNEAQKFLAKHGTNRTHAHRARAFAAVPARVPESDILGLTISSPLQSFASLGLSTLASYIESLLTGSSFKPLEGPLYPVLFGPGGLFGGRPKLLDTQQAAARALESKNPAIALYGLQLAYLASQGVPLSSSSAQPVLSSIFSNAVTGLEALGFPKAQAQTDLTNIISSQIAMPGIQV